MVWNDNVDAADDNDDDYGNDFENFAPGGREGEGGSWKKLEQVQVGLFYHLSFEPSPSPSPGKAA